jgi:hypothetical protein
VLTGMTGLVLGLQQSGQWGWSATLPAVAGGLALLPRSSGGSCIPTGRCWTFGAWTARLPRVHCGALLLEPGEGGGDHLRRGLAAVGPGLSPAATSAALLPR